MENIEKQKFAVVRSFLDYEPGEIIDMEEGLAAPFVQAGLIEQAPEETVDRVEAPEYVANAARDLKEKMDAAVVEATRKAVEKVGHHAAPTGLKLPAQAKDNKWGFKSIGDFASCVIAKERGELSAARKLDSIRTKVTFTTGTTFGPQVTANDGGVLIPPDYADEIFEKVKGVTDLTANCTEYPVSGNTVEIPVDNETSMSTGIQTYWVAEDTVIPETKPVLGLVEVKLKKLAVLVPITEELQADSAYALDTFIQRRVPLKVIHQKNENLLRGAGGGANIINHASTIVINRAVANRITFADITAMYSRLHAENLPNAAWYVSPSIFAELQRLSFDTGGTFPVFSPGQGSGGYPGIAGTPVGTLYGRPVIMSENLSALGTKGDLMLADLGAVALIRKQFEAASSIHLHFDKYVNTLRFVFRMNTASQWLTPWTRVDGVTASPYVVLGPYVAPMAFADLSGVEAKKEPAKAEVKK